MLNKFAAANGTGKIYEPYPIVLMSEGGSRYDPTTCVGISNLYNVLSGEPRLKGHKVIVLARNALRFARDPAHMSAMIESAERMAVVNKITELSFDALDLYGLDFNLMHKKGFNLSERIKKISGTQRNVTGVYNDEDEDDRSDGDLQKQEDINKTANMLSKSLDNSDAAGDVLRNQIHKGITMGTGLSPSFNMQEQLDAYMSAFKGDSKVRDDAVDTIINIGENYMRNNPSKKNNIRGVGFSRCSLSTQAITIGDSTNIQIGGARQGGAVRSSSSLRILSEERFFTTS